MFEVNVKKHNGMEKEKKEGGGGPASGIYLGCQSKRVNFRLGKHPG